MKKIIYTRKLCTLSERSFFRLFSLYTGVIREDMCGFEEVTHEPQPAEFRPTMTPDPNITSRYYIDDGGLSSGEKKLLIGMVKSTVFITCVVNQPGSVV